jgi:ABC-type uncharacterized transport system substrate-binding protein
VWRRRSSIAVKRSIARRPAATTRTPGAFAAKHATSTIPVVMASVGDPVRSGLVASLARPGGNVTGMTVLGPELEAKRLGLLKQAMPKISRVAVLWNPANPAIRCYYEETQKAAALLQVTLEPVVEIRGIDDFDRAFATITKERPDAIVVLADRFFLAHRHRIVEFAVGKRQPGMYAYRWYADVWGLMVYAQSDIELFRSAAQYVDKILKGAKPQDLPIQEPSKFELPGARPDAPAVDPAAGGPADRVRRPPVSRARRPPRRSHSLARARSRSRTGPA